MHYTQLTRT